MRVSTRTMNGEDEHKNNAITFCLTLVRCSGHRIEAHGCVTTSSLDSQSSSKQKDGLVSA